MRIEVYVTPYVFKYLKHTYLDDPYIITGAQNDLRIAFEFLSFRAYLPPIKLGKLGGHKITLDLGDNPALAALAENTALLKSGAFYQHEFNLALRRYIQAQEDLSSELGLTAYEWSRDRSIKTFFAKYGITEDDYSLDSAYRQTTRTKDADLRFFSEKIRTMFGFSGSGNSDYALARLVKDGPDRLLMFNAWSRSKKQRRRCRIYVPRKIRDTDKEPFFIENGLKIINSFLLAGRSVA